MCSSDLVCPIPNGRSAQLARVCAGARCRLGHGETRSALARRQRLEVLVFLLRRGHQALLPANSAYRFVASRPSAILLQTILGDDTVQRWADICLS